MQPSIFIKYTRYCNEEISSSISSSFFTIRISFPYPKWIPVRYRLGFSFIQTVSNSYGPSERPRIWEQQPRQHPLVNCDETPTCDPESVSFTRGNILRKERRGVVTKVNCILARKVRTNVLIFHGSRHDTGRRTADKCVCSSSALDDPENVPMNKQISIYQKKKKKKRKSPSRLVHATFMFSPPFFFFFSFFFLISTSNRDSALIV